MAAMHMRRQSFALGCCGLSASVLGGQCSHDSCLMGKAQWLCNAHQKGVLVYLQEPNGREINAHEHCDIPALVQLAQLNRTAYWPGEQYSGGKGQCSPSS